MLEPTRDRNEENKGPMQRFYEDHGWDLDDYLDDQDTPQRLTARDLKKDEPDALPY